MNDPVLVTILTLLAAAVLLCGFSCLLIARRVRQGEKGVARS